MQSNVNGAFDSFVVDDDDDDDDMLFAIGAAVDQRILEKVSPPRKVGGERGGNNAPSSESTAGVARAHHGANARSTTWKCPRCTVVQEGSKSCSTCGAANPRVTNQWRSLMMARPQKPQLGSKSTNVQKKKTKKITLSSQRPGQTKRSDDGTSNSRGGIPVTETYHPQKIQKTIEFMPAPSRRPLASIDLSPSKSYLAGRPKTRLDMDAAQSWIYPTNYPVRDYQRHIVQSALFQNTLVCLPTGLGKTFIAAVVMYNFYRWYPDGKVVFMAPTKPLVEQQVEACHKIMSIPQVDTARLDGGVAPAKREKLWEGRRVFFCTPQTFENDAKRGVVPLHTFTCVVIDEAHRATGRYAYVGAVEEVMRQCEGHVRILALSATPGSTKEAVQEVIQKLFISKVEMRTDNDPDVRRYVKHREVQHILVKAQSGGSLDSLQRMWGNTVIRVFARRLFERGLLRASGNPWDLSKGLIYMAYQSFKTQPPRGISGEEYRYCNMAFCGLIRLAHCSTLLKSYGLQGFIDHMQKIKHEELASKNPNRITLSLVRSETWAAIERKVAEVLESGAYEHPKMRECRRILAEHFDRAQQVGRETRAIIFSNFRSSVEQIVASLNADNANGLIKARQFVGQSSASGASKASNNTERKSKKGMNQAEQQAAVREFRDGLFNVIVATSIGEEGLDIGQVDLIIAYDAVGSPIRMTQRFGRTGRKRAGRVIVLMTADEERKAKKAASKGNQVNRKLAAAKNTFQFCKDVARMLPADVEPKVIEKQMVVSEFHSSRVGGRGALEEEKRQKAKLAMKRKRRDENGNTIPNWVMTVSQEIKAKEICTQTLSQQEKVRKRFKMSKILDGRRFVRSREPHWPTMKKFLLQTSATTKSLLSVMQSLCGNAENLEWPLSKYAELSKSALRPHASPPPRSRRSIKEMLKTIDTSASPSALSAASEEAQNGPARDSLDQAQQVHEAQQDVSLAVPDDAIVAVGNDPANGDDLAGDLADDPAMDTDKGGDEGWRFTINEHVEVYDQGLWWDAVVTDRAMSLHPESATEHQLYTVQTVVHHPFDRSRFMSEVVPQQMRSAVIEDESPLESLAFPSPPQIRSAAVLRTMDNGSDPRDAVPSRKARAETPKPEVIEKSGFVEEERAPRSPLASIRKQEPKKRVLELSQASSDGEASNDGDRRNESPHVDVVSPSPLASVSSRSSTSNVGKRKRRFALSDDSSGDEEDGDGGETAHRSLTKRKTAARVSATCSKAGESEAGESEAGESEAGESEAGESEAGEIADDRSCDVCGYHESRTGDEIIFCDGCDIAVHQSCYYIDTIPSGDWFCRSCKQKKTAGAHCQLCPALKLPLLPAGRDTWIHIQCAWWMPEVKVRGPSRVRISSIPRDRFTTLMCSICRIKHGACIQCAHPGCTMAFHVTCAQSKGYLCLRDTSNEFLSFCKLHQLQHQQREKDIVSYAPLSRPLSLDPALLRRARRQTRRSVIGGVIDDEAEDILDIDGGTKGRRAAKSENLKDRRDEMFEYDMNDSFIHDSQSSQQSSQGSATSPMLDPFLAAAMAMNDSPDDQTSPGMHIHGKRARMADMPIIESCLRSIQNRNRQPDVIDLSNSVKSPEEPLRARGRRLLQLSAPSEEENDEEVGGRGGGGGGEDETSLKLETVQDVKDNVSVKNWIVFARNRHASRRLTRSVTGGSFFSEKSAEWKVAVYEEAEADYIVSLRQAIRVYSRKKFFKQLGRRSTPITDSNFGLEARNLIGKFSRITVIVEHDGEGDVDVDADPSCRSIPSSMLIASMIDSRVQIIYTYSKRGTIEAISSISKQEVSLGFGIIADLSPERYSAGALAFLRCLPGISSISALRLVSEYESKSLAQLFNSSRNDLRRALPGLHPKVLARILRSFKCTR